MKKAIYIAVSLIYLSFTIGIAIHVHLCNDGHLNEEVASPEIFSDCSEEESHSCCEMEVVENCCEKEQKDEDCCYDGHVLFQLEEAQEVSRSIVFISFPSLLTLGEKIEPVSECKDTAQNEFISRPPPDNEELHILHCSFTFYG